jgi:hypothetical protein
MRPKKVEIDLGKYAELRMVLDSLERGVLRYYLDAPSQAARDKRLYDLREGLQPIHDKVWGRMGGQPCPPGYFDCNGCCVDYPCIAEYGLGSVPSPRK